MSLLQKLSKGSLKRDPNRQQKGEIFDGSPLKLKGEDAIPTAVSPVLGFFQ